MDIQVLEVESACKKSLVSEASAVQVRSTFSYGGANSLYALRLFLCPSGEFFWHATFEGCMLHGGQVLILR